MNQRPLSPHLQVYRLPVTAMLSIGHRITGVVLSIGMIFWVVYLLAAMQGGAAFETVQSVVASLPGRVVLWVWIYALFFHLCHGVRHLVWDTVHGLDRDRLDRDSFIEIAVSLVLTLGLLVFTVLSG